MQNGENAKFYRKKCFLYDVARKHQLPYREKSRKAFYNLTL